VPKPELGKKRTCLDCGAHYYDLNADKPKCPKCGTPYDLGVPAKGKPKDKKPPKEATVAAKESETDEEEIIDDDELEALVEETDDEKHEADDDDEGLIADASDLGTDDDDLSEVREHMDEEVIDTVE